MANYFKYFLILFIILNEFISHTQDSLFYREFEHNSFRAYSQRGNFIKTSDEGLLINVNHPDTINFIKRVSLIRLNKFYEYTWEIDLINLWASTDIIEDNDGNLILASKDSTLKGVIIKMDAAGNIIWTQKSQDIAYASEIINIGDYYYLMGSQISMFNSWENDYFISKFDKDGNLIWSKIYDTGHGDYLTKAIKTNDNNLLLIGRYKDELNLNKYVHCMKITQDGNIIWSKIYTYDDGEVEVIDAIENEDGDFAFTGRSHGSFWHILFLLIDEDGNYIRSRTYDRLTFQEGYSIHRVQGDGYMICIEPEAYFHETSPTAQTGMLKISNNGDVENVVVYKIGTMSSFPFGSLQLDNGYLLLGVKDNRNTLWLAKTDLDANLNCEEILVDIGSEIKNPGSINELVGIYETGPIFNPTNISVEVFFFDDSVFCSSVANIPEPPPIEHYIPNVPNVFSPNGDNINDVFLIDYPYSEGYLLQIINRWGVVIFESKSPTISWNGYVQSTGRMASEGTYFWKLSVGELSNYGTVSLFY